MGAKKHKKDSKKKKHRSRSRSPMDGEERERKRHKKHKDRKKDRSPDVQEVPVDSHLRSADTESLSSSPNEHERERERRAKHAYKETQDERQRGDIQEVDRTSEDGSADTQTGGATQESLSVEATNLLRAKLGLKPLELSEKPADDGKIKDDLGEFYHKPAINITEQKKTEKLREKLEERKEKRKLDQKLKTLLLADESDDEDASAWVKKSRAIENQKKEAAKRAALLDEMDAVFGVSALVAEEQRRDAADSYGGRHLRGLRVAHDVNDLGDEREVVLTLADKDVLAEEEDELVNVNLLDVERTRKNIEERKKAKSGYQAYDDEADMEAAALGFKKSVLAKYDEHINEGKPDKSKGFVIGDEDVLEAKHFRDVMRTTQINEGRRLESLVLPSLQIATDYYNEQELSAKFKKSKRKGKIRKKPKQEPIDVDDYEAGNAPLDTDDTDVKREHLWNNENTATALVEDEESAEVDVELHAALARARRLRQTDEAKRRLPKVEEVLQNVKEELPAEEEAGMLLDATAEFCRTLAAAPAPPAPVPHDKKEHEEEEIDTDWTADPRGEEASGAWSRVDTRAEARADIAAGGASGGLEAEPALGAGVAGALRLALSKGYLERSGPAPQPRAAAAAAAAAHLLAARHYSIDDKAAAPGEDDKYGRRERGGHGGHSGPLQDFREKAGFRPTVKLEYVDDDGRPLCPKEAFRYLSHKFHGKGPGKNKQEKRIKKAVQEGLMKKMSSTDTPLNTLQMLQEKQRETHSAYVVLSGTKREPNT